MVSGANVGHKCPIRKPPGIPIDMIVGFPDACHSLLGGWRCSRRHRGIHISKRYFTHRIRPIRITDSGSQYPLEFAKTRVQLRSQKGIPTPRNPFLVVTQVYKTEGIRALYKGCGALVVVCIPRASSFPELSMTTFYVLFSSFYGIFFPNIPAFPRLCLRLAPCFSL
jgi:hypothetical protein